MFRRTLLAGAAALLIGSGAWADPWKDESGHGRWGPGWGQFKQEWRGDFEGETPWWARGKGYWDGHFKHYRSGPPPWAGMPGGFHSYYDMPPRYPGFYYPG